MKFLIVEPSPLPFLIPLGPNIRVRIRFSKNLSLYSSLDLKDYVPQPYKRFRPTINNLREKFYLDWESKPKPLAFHASMHIQDSIPDSGDIFLYSLNVNSKCCTFSLYYFLNMMLGSHLIPILSYDLFC